jgi:hypothetical protein
MSYERSDAPPRNALIGLGVLFACVFVALGLAAIFAVAFNSANPPMGARRVPPPAPRLEVHGGSDLAQVRAIGAERLATYGWTDRAAGLAHIPIDRAMAITAARGWRDQEAKP